MKDVKGSVWSTKIIIFIAWQDGTAKLPQIIRHPQIGEMDNVLDALKAIIAQGKGWIIDIHIRSI